MVSELDGFPVANYTIGQLQSKLDLSSYENLLESLRHIRDLAFAASRALLAVEGLRTDKYTMNQTEVVTYIDEVIAASRYPTIVEGDKDFIAGLILAFEANPTAWTLFAAEGNRNVPVQASKLYNYVLLDASANDLFVYTPNDKVVPFGTQPQYAEQTGKRDSAKTENALNDGLVLARFSACRVVDHAINLLLDQNIWYTFVSPRFDGRSTAANIERGKTLQTLALYAQGLLNYALLFNFEVFMHSVDSLSHWTDIPVHLGGRTVSNLALAREHDYFNAKQDVHDLLSSFEDSGDSSFTGKFYVLPEETMAYFGLRKALDNLDEVAAKFTYLEPMDRISDLNSGRYLPLVSSTSVAELDLRRAVSKIVILSKTISTEVDSILDILISFIGRNTAPDVIAKLRAADIYVPFRFNGTVSTSYHPMVGVDMVLRDGVLKLDSAAPRHSGAYLDYLQLHFLNRMFTGNIVMKDYPYADVRQIVNEDKAAFLRTLIGGSYRTLIPNHMAFKEYTYYPDELSSNSEQFMDLISKLIGVPYELAVMELAIPRVRMVWATVLSSFASMFVDEDVLDTGDGTVANNPVSPENSVLVIGHGSPFGTDYSRLNEIQHKKDKEDLRPYIQIIPGVWIKFHLRIPVITRNMVRVKDQFFNHADLMFQSNGDFEEVTGWHIHDAMWHHALIPVTLKSCVPPLVFSDMFVYLNNDLYVHAQRGYKPSAAEAAREHFRVEVSKHAWSNTVLQPYIEYRTFGTYSKSVEQSAEIPEAELAKIVKKIDESNTASLEEAKAGDATISDAANKAAEVMVSEVNLVNNTIEKSSSKDVDHNL